MSVLDHLLETNGFDSSSGDAVTRSHPLEAALERVEFELSVPRARLTGGRRVEMIRRAGRSGSAIEWLSAVAGNRESYIASRRPTVFGFRWDTTLKMFSAQPPALRPVPRHQSPRGVHTFLPGRSHHSPGCSGQHPCAPSAQINHRL